LCQRSFGTWHAAAAARDAAEAAGAAARRQSRSRGTQSAAAATRRTRRHPCPTSTTCRLQARATVVFRSGAVTCRRILKPSLAKAATPAARVRLGAVRHRWDHSCGTVNAALAMHWIKAPHHLPLAPQQHPCLHGASSCRCSSRVWHAAAAVRAAAAAAGAVAHRLLHSHGIQSAVDATPKFWQCLLLAVLAAELIQAFPRGASMCRQRTSPQFAKAAPGTPAPPARK